MCASERSPASMANANLSLSLSRKHIAFIFRVPRLYLRRRVHLLLQRECKGERERMGRHFLRPPRYRNCCSICIILLSIESGLSNYTGGRSIERERERESPYVGKFLTRELWFRVSVCRFVDIKLGARCSLGRDIAAE